MSRTRTHGGDADVAVEARATDDRELPPAGILTGPYGITGHQRAADEPGKSPQRLERIVAECAAELAAMNAQLEAAHEELEGFAHSVSHDLRVPLRAIDGFSRILLEDYADKLDVEGRRLLYVVRNSTVKLGNLIDDIRAFSRIGSAEIHPHRLDMEALVHDVLDVPLAAAIIGRTLVVDIAKLPPARGDRAMLRRVWSNLLDNALKFTAPKSDALIQIGATAGDAETVYWVRDNGVGFDMQSGGKLFGVFQRLHGDEFAGTGIGLAIVKRIVTRHGGRVWVEGRVGDGAVAYFALPNQEKTR